MTNFNQAQEAPLPQRPANQGLGIVLLVMQTLAVSVEVFLRRRIGSRYMDKPGAFAVLLIPCWSLFWPEEDPRPLFWFLGAYLVMCARVRMTSLRRRFRGEEGHTRYNGWPIILSLPLLRRLSEAKAKAAVEPLLVVLVGAMVMNSSPPLGSYLVAAAVGLMLSHGALEAHERTRLMDMNDSVIDQRHLAERFRRGNR
jgi:hypothetical protein